MIYDFCILGAGIAGLSLADAFAEQDFSIIVLEKDDIAFGASGTPGGLVNPATGRQGKKTWKAEVCYAAICRNLEKVQKFSSRPFYKKNGLLRPALSNKMARKMHREFDQTAWPNGWCYWQTEQQIKKHHPGINCVKGGLWLPIALTVDVKAYLKAYAQFLQAAGVEIQTHAKANYHRENGYWIIHTSNMHFRSKNLIFATGFSTIDHLFWNFLPLEGVKGQIAAFKATKSLLTFKHSISSMGYIARLDKTNGFIQGSTYEHNFDDLGTDEEGAKYLRSRTQKVLPELAQHAKLVKQWAGARVNTPDRKPVIGAHHKMKSLHVFTGLGSKGLMYGKFLANHYAKHLKSGSFVFPEVSIKRFTG
jgi:glycine/D-amino acid oxidase-like deaminating enzyme